MATFPFTAEGPGELTFSEGDQVELLERVDAAWMKGRLRGKEGIFPTEFVKVIVELPPQDSKASKAAGASKGMWGRMVCGVVWYVGSYGMWGRMVCGVVWCLQRYVCLQRCVGSYGMWGRMVCGVVWYVGS